jgi:hypothetical protein
MEKVINHGKLGLGWVRERLPFQQAGGQVPKKAHKKKLISEFNINVQLARSQLHQGLLGTLLVNE